MRSVFYACLNNLRIAILCKLFTLRMLLYLLVQLMFLPICTTFVVKNFLT